METSYNSILETGEKPILILDQGTEYNKDTCSFTTRDNAHLGAKHVGRVTSSGLIVYRSVIEAALAVNGVAGI